MFFFTKAWHVTGVLKKAFYLYSCFLGAVKF